MRLGVFRKSDIESAASKRGFVNVIRFQDTELLSRRISSRDAVFKTYVKDKVQSMLRVDAQMFDDVMTMQFLEGTSE